MWAGSDWLKIRSKINSSENNNEPSNSTNIGELIDYLSYCQLLVKDSYPSD
jgi:hypothetical protein